MVEYKILFPILIGFGCFGLSGAICCLSDEIKREILNKFLSK